MGSVNSKLFIIKADFELVKKNTTNVRGILKSVDLLEVDDNHEVTKTSIIYPKPFTTTEKNVSFKDEEIEWDCLNIEDNNETLRTALEEARTIIVPDKTTMELIENFVYKNTVEFIIRK